MVKNNIVFKNIDSLQPVVNVINEASSAINDKKCTIKESAIPEVLAGALGAGITSGLAAAGGIVGGGMVAGIFVLAAPIAVLSAGGVGVAAHLKNKQLKQEKERLYKEALKKHQAIISALKVEVDADKERLDYLQSLNILLQQAIKDLKSDLGIVA